MILAGDVGGTKTNLALVSGGEGALQITKVRSFESQRYPGLEAIIQDFLLGVQATIDRACIGVAGPDQPAVAHERGELAAPPGDCARPAGQ